MTAAREHGRQLPARPGRYVIDIEWRGVRGYYQKVWNGVWDMAIDRALRTRMSFDVACTICDRLALEHPEMAVSVALDRGLDCGEAR